MFVEARTATQTIWTFEKVTTGIIVQVSRDEATPAARVFRNGEERGRIEKSVEDDHPKECTVDDVLDWIVSQELSKSYHFAESNCAFFANNLFSKFANRQYPIEPRVLNYSNIIEEVQSTEDARIIEEMEYASNVFS